MRQQHLVKDSTKDGTPLTMEQAGLLASWWRTSFPQLVAWQQAELKSPCREGVQTLRSPLGVVAKIPKGKQGRWQSIAARIGQLAEADALRIVLANTASVMEGTGAAPVLLIHDAVIWEVPWLGADEAYRRAKALMKEALFHVCAPCPAVAKLETRLAWGGGESEELL